MKIIRTSGIDKISDQQSRFRASIYVDVIVPKTGNLEAEREQARKIVDSIQANIPNSYIGGVAFYTSEVLGLDKEI